MLKLEFSDGIQIPEGNTKRFEALTALVSLGFDKKAVDKVLDSLAKNEGTVEELIKGALKLL
jgi:Holliday junction DNA helicase RuvA